MKSKKENIAEYILYLWQIEDYLRAFPQQADANPELKEIAEMMHAEGIMDRGHLQLAENALSELEDLSRELAEDDATSLASSPCDCVLKTTPASMSCFSSLVKTSPLWKSALLVSRSTVPCSLWRLRFQTMPSLYFMESSPENQEGQSPCPLTAKCSKYIRLWLPDSSVKYIEKSGQYCRYSGSTVFTS